jgi:hypothetical protein
MTTMQVYISTVVRERKRERERLIGDSYNLCACVIGSWEVRWESHDRFESASTNLNAFTTSIQVSSCGGYLYIYDRRHFVMVWLG